MQVAVDVAHEDAALCQCYPILIWQDNHQERDERVAALSYQRFGGSVALLDLPSRTILLCLPGQGVPAPLALSDVC